MRIIILIISFLIFSFSGFTQIFHVNTGLCRSSVDWKYKYLVGGEEVQYLNSLNSYMIGFGVELMHEKNFSLTSGVLFYEAGGQRSEKEKEQISSYIFTSTDIISVNYLSISPTLNFNPINNKIKLQIAFGPRVDFLVEGINEDPYLWINKRGGINRVNFGLSAGTGIFYKWNYLYIGINYLFTVRMRNVANLLPESTSTNYYGGAEASEQIHLISISIGIDWSIYKMKLFYKKT